MLKFVQTIEVKNTVKNIDFPSNSDKLHTDTSVLCLKWSRIPNKHLIFSFCHVTLYFVSYKLLISGFPRFYNNPRNLRSRDIIWTVYMWTFICGSLSPCIKSHDNSVPPPLVVQNLQSKWFQNFLTNVIIVN